MRPRIPSIHITQVEEIEGRLVESPVTSPVCDFCGDLGPTWDYPCARFELPDIEFGSMEGWAACNTCSALVEIGDWGAMLRRLGSVVEMSVTMQMRMLRIWREFTYHRLGPRVPFG